MKKLQAQAVIDKYLPLVIELLGIQSQVINVKLVKSGQDGFSNDNFGVCNRKPEYKEATIHIFYEIHDTVADLKVTLFHEIAHVFLGRYTNYQTMVNTTFDTWPSLTKAMDESFRQADEEVTSELSHILARVFEK